MEELKARLASIFGPFAPERSEALIAVHERLLGGQFYFGHERRSAVRFPLSTPVVVAPLDEWYTPTAASQQATLIDLSALGAGLLTPSMGKLSYILIDFNESGVQNAQLLARVAWAHEQESYAKYGCEFIADVGDL